MPTVEAGDPDLDEGARRVPRRSVVRQSVFAENPTTRDHHESAIDLVILGPAATPPAPADYRRRRTALVTEAWARIIAQAVGTREAHSTARREPPTRRISARLRTLAIPGLD